MSLSSRLHTPKKELKNIWPALIALATAETLAAFETASAAQLLYAPDALFGGVDLPTLSWIITAFMLAGAVSVAFAGRLGDQFGRKKVLMIIIGLSIAGSLISVLAPNIVVLIAGRALQGIAAAILPLGLGIIRSVFPEERHGLGIAVVTTTALIAGALGMLASGFILDAGSWRLIFVVSAILGIVAGLLTHFLVPANQAATLATDNRVDYLGGTLFGAGIAFVLYGVTTAQKTDWSDALVLLYLAIGVLGLLLWVWWEKSIDYPMINLSRFRNRKFATGMAATALLSIGPIGMINVFVTSINRTDGSVHDNAVGIGMSASLTGIIGTVGAALAFACSPLIGKIATRWGAKSSLLIGCIIEILGFSLFLIDPTSAMLVVSSIWIVTAGTAFIYSGMPTIIAESVPGEEVSAATGLNAVIRTTFQGVAATVVAILMSINSVRVENTEVMSTHGLNWVVAVNIALVVLAMFLLIRLPAFNSEIKIENQAKQKA